MVFDMMEDTMTDIFKFDDLSNSILQMIKDGEFDKAEVLCEQFQHEYPDQIDGFRLLPYYLRSKEKTLKPLSIIRKPLISQKRMMALILCG